MMRDLEKVVQTLPASSYSGRQPLLSEHPSMRSETQETDISIGNMECSYVARHAGWQAIEAHCPCCCRIQQIQYSTQRDQAGWWGLSDWGWRRLHLLLERSSGIISPHSRCWFCDTLHTAASDTWDTSSRQWKAHDTAHPTDERPFHDSHYAPTLVSVDSAKDRFYDDRFYDDNFCSRMHRLARRQTTNATL